MDESFPPYKSEEQIPFGHKKCLFEITNITEEKILSAFEDDPLNLRAAPPKILKFTRYCINPFQTYLAVKAEFPVSLVNYEIVP